LPQHHKAQLAAPFLFFAAALSCHPDRGPQVPDEGSLFDCKRAANPASKRESPTHRSTKKMVKVDGTGNSNSLIKIRGLDKTYRRGGEEIHVLQSLNLDVDQGEFVAFMGPSGSGKTTLLNLLGGLDVPTKGSITVANDEVTHMSSGKLTQWRARHVGFIFQMYNLIPVLTAFQNVELPLLLTNLSKSERRSHVEASLSIVGLADRMNHYPRQLSGGQEQRVAIARAIVADPTFLLCDEPTGDLDRKSADEILELLTRFSKEHNKTILMVTHDPQAADRAQATLHLNKGVLVESTHAGSLA
jgi:putative ABC transport system ATP-binding protein